MNLAASKRNWPLGRGLRAVLRLPRRGDQPVVSGPGPRQPPGRRAGHPGRGLPPQRRPDRQGDRVHRRRQDDRPGPAGLPVLRPRVPRTRRTTCRGSGPTGTRAASTWATRRRGSRSWPGRRSSGIVPADTELPPINPIGTPEDRTGPGRQAVPAAGLHQAVGQPVRRRAAAVRPDGRGVRRLPLPRRRPDRPAARLPRGDRPAGQHDRSSSSRTTAPAARAARTARSTRTSSSTASPTTSPPTWPCSTSSAARRPTTTTRPAGRWPSTPRSRCGSATRSTAAPADPCIVSWPAGIPARGEIRDQYHHAIDLVPTVLDCLGIAAAGRRSRASPRSRSRASACVQLRRAADAPSTRTTQFYSMLGTRGIWHDGWKAVTTHPAHRRLGQLRAGHLGAVPRRRSTAPSCTTWPPRNPTGSPS